jgi:hypothetical protein
MLMSACTSTRNIPIPDMHGLEYRGGSATVSVPGRAPFLTDSLSAGFDSVGSYAVRSGGLILTVDGKDYRTDGFAIRNDSVSFDDVHVPLRELQSIRKREFSVGNTLALSGGLVAGLGVVALALYVIYVHAAMR